MNSINQRYQNDITGLTLVHQFGWIRAKELGLQMWPTSHCNRQMIDRLIRGWEERRLVISRQLPEHAGKVVVLATAGVRLLADAGVDAASGKDYGRHVDGKWQPPASWRHDIVGHGILADLSRRGYRILSEVEIRRALPSNWKAKVPDGVAIHPTKEQVFWLEVERGKKGGRDMRHLIQTVVDVSAGRQPPILGHKPTAVLLGFLTSGKLDHRKRVTSAIKRLATSRTLVVWALCESVGVGVASVDYKAETFEPVSQEATRSVADGAASATSTHEQAFLSMLDKKGWTVEDSGLRYSFDGAGYKLELNVLEDRLVSAVAIEKRKNGAIQMMCRESYSSVAEAKGGIVKSLIHACRRKGWTPYA